MPSLLRWGKDRSCKSLSSGIGFHRGSCIRIALCVVACFCNSSMCWRYLLIVNGCDSSRSLLRREVAIVFVTCDCSQNIPSRGTAHAMHERLYLVSVDADLSGANSSPQGPLHPKHRADWLRRFGSSHRIHGLSRVGPSGRDLGLHWATRIEQPPTNFGLRCLLSLR